MTTSDPGDQNPSEGSMPPTHQPYGKQPPPDPDSYGPPPVPNPYGDAPQQQNPYGQAAPSPYGQTAPSPYGQGHPQPGQAPGYGYGMPVAASHPSATTALVLSLIGLAGIVFCGGITLVLSPFAWRIGARAVREIDASPGQYSGRDQANAGRIMGIIGTALLALGVVVVVLGLVLLVVAGTSTSP